MTAGDVTPEKFLEELSPILGQTGCIKSAHDVDKFINRMEDPDLLLVPKVVLAGAVRATKAPSTLEKFMSSGGWAIINNWLEHSMKKGEENYAFITVLLEVLRKLPVTVEYLQQGNIGKLVKQLKKAENEDASAAATHLLKEWLIVVKKHQNPTQVSKEAQEKLRRRQEEEKRQAAIGPISASVRAKEKEAAAKAVPKPKRGKTKKKPEETKADEPAEKRIKPPDLTKLGSPLDKDKKDKTKSPTAPSAPPPVESAGFMNALSVAHVAKAPRARKKSVPPPAKPGARPGMKSDSTADDSPRDPSGPGLPGDQPMELEEGAQLEAPEATDLRPLPAPSSYSGGGVLVSPGQRNRKRKKVTWAPPETIRDVYFFEIEEGERVNMHAKNFMDTAKMEKEKEAQALRAYRTETTVESVPWRLIPITFDIPRLTTSGFKSMEKAKQERREQSTLAFLFLSKASLPDTPGEPEPELPNSTRLATAEPKLIPIHDETDPSAAPAGVGVPVGLDSNQTQATVQSLLDKLKTKGVIAAPGEGVPLPGANIPQQQGPVGMPGHFAPGQPMANRPPGPGGMGGPGMFEGQMPPHHPGMMQPQAPQQQQLPGQNMAPHDAGYQPSPQQQHQMHAGFMPQEGPPPPMGRGGGGAATWHGAMGPGGPAGGPGGPVGGPAGPVVPPGGHALLPTPPVQQNIPPQGMQSTYQDEYAEGARQDYHADMEGPHGNRGSWGGGYRGRRGRGRGGPVTCRHYMSPRGCTMGDKCRFFHPPPGSLDNNWEAGGGGGGGGNNIPAPAPAAGGGGGGFYERGPPGQYHSGSHSGQFHPGGPPPSHQSPPHPPKGPTPAAPYQHSPPRDGPHGPPLDLSAMAPAASSGMYTADQPVAEARHPHPHAKARPALGDVPEIVSTEPARPQLSPAAEMPAAEPALSDPAISMSAHSSPSLGVNTAAASPAAAADTHVSQSAGPSLTNAESSHILSSIGDTTAAGQQPPLAAAAAAEHTAQISGSSAAQATTGVPPSAEPAVTHEYARGDAMNGTRNNDSNVGDGGGDSGGRAETASPLLGNGRDTQSLESQSTGTHDQIEAEETTARAEES